MVLAALLFKYSLSPPGAPVSGAVFGPPSVPGPFYTLPDGTMPPMFHEILRSSVIGIYDDNMPVCTAVFFTKSRALTAEHDAQPALGSLLFGRASPSNARSSELQWTFRVVSVSKPDDLVVLERVVGPEPDFVLPLCAASPIVSLKSRKVWLATFGISAAARSGDAAGSVSVGSSTDETRIAAVGGRHCVYSTNTGRGDSGSAVITFDGELIGLHLGGWNDADSPPPSPDDKARASSSGEHAHKSRERLAAMGLDDAGTATQKSVVNLARQLSTGGYALFLGSAAVAAMCSACSPVVAGGGDVGGVGVKRTRLEP